jgi:hypothetical protein
MITKMIRGKQEDTVGAVEDRQVVQEEEEEEEEMKTENMEGTESNKNMSSGASGAEADIFDSGVHIQLKLNENMSSGALTQKRTTASVNIARAVSAGVANDPKQTLTPQVPVRGLIETISMRATTIYNIIYNINKATSIPNRLNNNSTDNNNNNNNNNINGVDNVIQNEENNNSVNNSMDNNMINIYDPNIIRGVDNIIQNGENSKLVNNSTANININDNIRNNVTPGEENSKLKSVDSDPLILRPDNSNLEKS